MYVGVVFTSISVIDRLILVSSSLPLTNDWLIDELTATQIDWKTTLRTFLENPTIRLGKQPKSADVQNHNTILGSKNVWEDHGGEWSNGGET